MYYWDPAYSVKIQSMDDQHKKWLDIIQKLYKAMKEGKGKTVLEEVLDELQDYTDYHFKAEEELMEKYNCPELANQKLLHAGFEKQLEKYKTDFDKGSITLTIDVMETLNKWLVNHIKKEDIKYTDFLNAAGVH